MDSPQSRDALSSTSLSTRIVEEPEDSIYRQYYTKNDFVLAPEGILKLLSALLCIVSSALVLSAGTCGAGRGAGAAALGGGASSALLYAVLALRLSLHAPQACLLTDIIVTTAMGLLLLIMAVLTMTVCEFTDGISYVHGPLGLLNGSLLLSNAVITYVSVMRQRDLSAGVASEPIRPATEEQDV